MDDITIQAGSEPAVTITAMGDLQIVAWDLPEIQVAVDEPRDEVRQRQDGQHVWLELLADATLRLPYASQVQVARVSGDLRVQDLTGPLHIAAAAGDVAVRHCGPLEIGQVSGDLSVKGVAGPATIAGVQGDVLLRDVAGPVRVARVSGDLNARALAGPCEVETAGGDCALRGVSGSAHVARVSGDLSLTEVLGPVNADRVDGDVDLDLVPGQPVRVAASGDVSCEIAPGTGAAFRVRGDSVRCLVPGVSVPRGGGEQSFTIGDGSAPIELRAGGRVVVRPRDGEWPGVDQDFDEEMEAMGEDLARRIESEVEQKLRQVDERLSVLDLRLGKTDEIERKIRERVRQQGERARQRAERAAARAGRHAGSGHSFFGWMPGGRPPAPPAPPAPPSAPVREEERLAILRMVAEKKITPAQAEALLAALEG
jgi:hypothetical protein